MVEQLKAEKPDADSINASMSGFEFTLVGNTITMIQMTTCKITFREKAKRSGEYKPRSKSVSISGKYCMFCGKLVKPTVDDKEKQIPS